MWFSLSTVTMTTKANSSSEEKGGLIFCHKPPTLRKIFSAEAQEHNIWHTFP